MSLHHFLFFISGPSWRLTAPTVLGILIFPVTLTGKSNPDIITHYSVLFSCRLPKSIWSMDLLGINFTLPIL